MELVQKDFYQGNYVAAAGLEEKHKRGVCFGLCVEWLTARGNYYAFKQAVMSSGGAARVVTNMDLMDHRDGTPYAQTRDYAAARLRVRGLIATGNADHGVGHRADRIWQAVSRGGGLFYCGLMGGKSGHAIALKNTACGDKRVYSLFDPNYFHGETDDADKFRRWLDVTFRTNYPKLKTWFLDGYRS